MTPDVNAQVQLWRQKAREGTLTQEEMKEAINVLRQGRVAAAKTSAASRSSKAKTPVNSDDLLKDLEGL